jgi:hypothetical protein
MTVEREDLAAAFGALFEESAAALGRVRAATQLANAETERVTQVIARDIATRYQDNDRKLAELRIRKGVSVDLLDLTVPPTPEWLDQGEHVSFTAPVPERSAKVVTTRRRVVIGHCLRALRAGRIDAGQYRACAWYQELFALSGYDGRIRTVDLAKEVHFQHLSGCHITDRQLLARSTFRAVRSEISPRWRKFFELVVLKETAVDVARRMAPSGRDPWKKLRDCANIVAAELEDIDPNWKGELTDVCF